MWIKGIMLAALGLCAGAAAAGGIFSFIIGLGVVSDLADRTHTGEQIRLYEDAVALGGASLAQSGSYFRSRSGRRLAAAGIWNLRRNLH